MCFWDFLYLFAFFGLLYDIVSYIRRMSDKEDKL